MANPIITKTFVTDINMNDARAYVADPLIVKDGGTWYLFFEAYDGADAHLVYGTSPDLVTWTYGSKLTIDGYDWLTSYPFVFKCDGIWWMVHNDVGATIKLYRPKTWPNDWTQMQTIVTHPGIVLRDTSIFQYDGVWYVIAYDLTNVNCRLYYGTNLYNCTWTEHPSSPILSGDDTSRPGGRPISRPGVGVDIFVQDSIPTYGEAVRIYRLTDLTPTTCTVTELATSPIIGATGVPGAWNKDGMHQLDRVDAGFSVVDGIIGAPQIFTIGAYEDVS